MFFTPPSVLTDEDVDRIAERLADRLSGPRLSDTARLADTIARLRYDGPSELEAALEALRFAGLTHDPEARLILAALAEATR